MNIPAIEFDHPCHLVDRFMSHVQSGMIDYSFGSYAYSPQSIEDIREHHRICSSYGVAQSFSSLLNTTPPDREIAFHSDILMDSGVMHFPMVDFSGHIEEHHWPILRTIMADFDLTELYLYSSGRSYHGYFPGLLYGDEWVRFMGSLLLANLPGKSEIIDTRWIGHRLRAGYASLRWTNQTNDYLALPKLDRVLKSSQKGIWFVVNHNAI